MIVNITAPPDFMMHELDEAMGVIQDTAPDAQIIFGLVYKDEMELGDEVLVTVIATGFDSNDGEILRGTDRSAASRYDDVDTYQKQPSSEQRVPGSGRALPGVGGASSGRSTVPGRGRKANATPPAEQDQESQGRQRKPTRGKDQGTPQRETDWEIPAFLRVQKRGRDDK
jgi:hypothetical protein